MTVAPVSVLRFLGTWDAFAFPPEAFRHPPPRRRSESASRAPR